MDKEIKDLVKYLKSNDLEIERLSYIDNIIKLEIIKKKSILSEVK